MRIINLIVYLLFSAVYSKAGAEPAIVINDPDWPPYFYAGKNKAKEGYAKKIISQCLDKHNYQYIFKFHPINRMRVSMEQGLIDVNIYSYKTSREDFLHFGKEVFFRSTYLPVVLKDSDITIKSLKDFDQYKLGHQIGLRYSDEYFEYISQRKNAGSLDEAPTNMSNLQKLLQKRIEIFVGSKGAIIQDAKRLKIFDKIKFLDFPVRDSEYFMSVSKKSPRISDKQKFLENFDSCLKKMKADNSYCQLADDYGIHCDRESLSPTVSD